MRTDQHVPRVTVLMSVYNGEKYLAAAVESILRQSFLDYEFLIINDGSTDHSSQIVRSYADPRIRIVENTCRIGLTRSLNKGLVQAKGELIARQDADDISHPTRLALQVAFMDKWRDVAVVGTQARCIDAEGKATGHIGCKKLCSELGLRWQMMFDSPFVHTSVLFRRDVVADKEGGYSEEFVTNQDYELWSRLSRKYVLRNLNAPLVDFRIHAASASANYILEQAIKVKDVLRANLLAVLPDYPEIEPWLDTWIRLNDRRTNEQTTAFELRRHLMTLRRMFYANTPAARAQPEIDRHLASLFLRGASILRRSNSVDAVQLALQAICLDKSIPFEIVSAYFSRPARDFLTHRRAYRATRGA
jgi:glycosyltransferase involved in cell wall biosynthesis